MATYKYKQNAYGSDSRYINYNITPDLPNGVAAGETVRVEGEIYNTEGVTTGIELRISGTTAGGQVLGEVYCSVPRSRAQTFSLSFTMPSLSSYNGSSRAKGYAINFACTQSGQTAMFSGTTSQSLTFLKYRLEPRVLAMEFERVDSAGNARNDGDRLRCKLLRIAKNASASVGEITTARITCAGSDGSSRSASLSASQLNAALTSAGYRESTASLFSFSSSLGANYTFTLTLGDAYDQASFSSTVMRAFARLHLSGASNGGVAVGMFSSATDSQPKFEVAEDHESHFYGPVSFDCAGRAPGSLIGLGLQFGNVPSVASVSAGSYGDTRVSFPTSYATDVIPAVFVSVAGGVTAGSFGRCWAGATSVTNAGFTLRFFNGDSAARSPSFYWFAMNMGGAMKVARPESPMTSDSSGGCVASASSTYSSSYPAWRAFDGSVGDSWASTASDAAPWLQLAMDVALKNISVEVSARQSTPVANPVSGAVLGSNNGTSWTQLKTFSGWSSTQSGGVLGTVNCANATAYRYVRLRVDSRTSSSSYVAIGSMVVRGDFDHYA